MEIGEPIEEQCVKLWQTVYGNIAMTLEDCRQAFHQQEPSVIEGWERLARRIGRVTTMQTLEHVGREH